MRRPAEWMTNSADDRILEYLSKTDREAPKGIASVTGFNNDYVGRRCRELADHGLLMNLGRGLYVITDKGQAYLAGELNAEDLENESA